MFHKYMLTFSFETVPKTTAQTIVPRISEHLRPGIFRRSTSVRSDGSGDVDMERLGEGAGRAKRAGILSSQWEPALLLFKTYQIPVLYGCQY